MAFNSINNITILGRLTAEPEVKTTQSGNNVLSFSVAVDRSYQKKDEERQTDFIPCVAWRGTADFIAKWAHKGDVIGVTGELQSRNYEDKNGNKRVAYEVIVGDVSICGSKKDGLSATVTNPTPTQHGAGIDVVANDDDLPF